MDSQTNQAKVALLGWATGGNWAGYYATVYSDRISRLILLNTLYGASDRHAMLGHGTDMESPKQPGKLNPAIGAYRFNTEASLFGVWDKSIPDGDKTTWRDLAVTKVIRQGCAGERPDQRHSNAPQFSIAERCAGRQFLPSHRPKTMGCILYSRFHFDHCRGARFLVPTRRPRTLTYRAHSQPPSQTGRNSWSDSLRSS